MSGWFRSTCWTADQNAHTCKLHGHSRPALLTPSVQLAPMGTDLFYLLRALRSRQTATRRVRPCSLRLVQRVWSVWSQAGATLRRKKRAVAPTMSRTRDCDPPEEATDACTRRSRCGEATYPHWSLRKFHSRDQPHHASSRRQSTWASTSGISRRYESCSNLHGETTADARQFLRSRRRATVKHIHDSARARTHSQSISLTSCDVRHHS